MTAGRRQLHQTERSPTSEVSRLVKDCPDLSRSARNSQELYRTVHNWQGQPQNSAPQHLDRRSASATTSVCLQSARRGGARAARRNRIKFPRQYPSFAGSHLGLHSSPRHAFSRVQPATLQRPELDSAINAAAVATMEASAKFRLEERIASLETKLDQNLESLEARLDRPM